MPAFLTAEWRFLVMLNYAVDRELLTPLLPRGVELDDFGGKSYVSLVAFRFERARVRGLWIPFHSDFDEVNLRFYVRRQVGSEVRRGVVFVREVVPRWACAKVAQIWFGERYVALPMTHKIIEPTSEGGRLQLEYRWRHRNDWSTVRAAGKGNPVLPSMLSHEFFFIEHYWGYTALPDGGTQEYRVEHDKWRIWPSAEATFEGRVRALYGPEFGERLERPPDSLLIAEGSTVTVHTGERI